MKMKRSWCVLALAAACSLAASAVVVSAQDAPGDDWTAPARAAKKKNPIPADDKSIAAGKQVYVKQCQSCHGESGKGDGPGAKDITPKPRDLGAQHVTDQTDGALFWKITEGQKPMPSFEKLTSEDERWEVIDFIRTFAKASNK